MAGKPRKKPSPPDAPPGSGRHPWMFTPERCAAIIQDISDRIPYILAAEANGICEDTLYDWLSKGKADKLAGINSDYANFSERIKKTEREKIKGHLDKIANNVERWQSDGWMLERRWYKHFGPNAQVNELNARLDKLEQGEKDARQLHSAKATQTKGEAE